MSMWLSVWSEVQVICIWSNLCNCRPIISCFIKIQNGLPFWCRLTRVVLEKRPLDGCSSSNSLFVCLFAYLEDYTAEFHQYSEHVHCGHGLVSLVVLQYVIYFGFVADVTYSHVGLYRALCKRLGHHCLN